MVTRLDPGESDEPSALADGQDDDGTENLLQECPDCGTVYLSNEQRVCTACDTATIPVQ